MLVKKIFKFLIFNWLGMFLIREAICKYSTHKEEDCYQRQVDFVLGAWLFVKRAIFSFWKKSWIESENTRKYSTHEGEGCYIFSIKDK